MIFPHRVPLAWSNLTHDRRRCLVSVAGVTFAVFLLFVQLGFWNALLDSSTQLIDTFNGDIVIVSKATDAMTSRSRFSRRRLEQARQVEGVRQAYPLYLETFYGTWKDTDPVEAKDPDAPVSYPIRVIAFDPNQPVLNLDGVEAHRQELSIPGQVLLDDKSKSDYGRREKGIQRELSGRSVKVAGTFSLGTDFTTDGNVIMSDVTFKQLYADPINPDATLNMVDIGIVQVRPGYDVQQVKSDLKAALPDDVEIYTRDEFARKEQQFWQTATPIGFIFMLGLIMGFVVGAVICYQIVSTDVTDQLAEYATLKAMGYSKIYLNWIVVQQAILLSLMGYVPGLIFGAIFYWLMYAFNGLPMYLTLGRVGLILALTVSMCTLSGFLAVRRVQRADPAEVFG